METPSVESVSGRINILPPFGTQRSSGDVNSQPPLYHSGGVFLGVRKNTLEDEDTKGEYISHTNTYIEVGISKPC